MKWLKISFSILGLLILISVAAVGSLLFFMDPNNLKPVLIEETKKQTGYQLAIEGALSWSFYPALAIKVNGMSLSEPRQLPFIELQGVRLTMDLLQLLQGNKKWGGKVAIDHMKLMNLNIEKVSTDVHWENHILLLDPIRASLYDGSLTGVAKGRDLSTLSRWEWDIKLTGIHIQPFLQDINGSDSKIKISGMGHITLQGNTQGKTRNQMLNNMDGEGQFSLTNGVVQGVDLNYFVQTADALINKQAINPPDNINQTSFSSLTGHLTIKKGVIETNDMLLTSSAFTTKGKGTVGLVSEVLNLNLLIAPNQDAKTQWQIPVSVSGEMSHPDIRLDMAEIEKFIARENIQKLKIKAEEQIQKHIPGKAGDFLQKLLH